MDSHNAEFKTLKNVEKYDKKNLNVYLKNFK